MIFKNYKVIITCLFSVLVIFASPSIAKHHLSTSSQFVQSLADQAVTALTADGITTDMRRKQFRDVMRQNFAIDSIARFALGRLDAASNQSRVKVVIVRSIWSIDKQTKIHVDWRVASQGNIYKVTDVMIEGISIARTKRDEFSSVIRRNNNEISAFLKTLREKKLNSR